MPNVTPIGIPIGVVVFQWFWIESGRTALLGLVFGKRVDRVNSCVIDSCNLYRERN
jgi:hypothetical protein